MVLSHNYAIDKGKKQDFSAGKKKVKKQKKKKEEKFSLLFIRRYDNLYKSEKEKESRVSTLTLAQMSD